jgi:hypothetical protein
MLRVGVPLDASDIGMNISQIPDPSIMREPMSTAP